MPNRSIINSTIFLPTNSIEDTFHPADRSRRHLATPPPSCRPMDTHLINRLLTIGAPD
jgi:hypothetical protein